MNFKTGTIWTGDNLDIMRGMDSRCVDLIYLDPPFNSKHDYSAPLDSKAAGAEFKDTWGAGDVDGNWKVVIKERCPKLFRVLRTAPSPSSQSYLTYMAIRLLEMKRLLAEDGSIYLHCDPTMSHYLKAMMDSIFGVGNYRNEIVWAYAPAGRSPNGAWGRKHDTILYYTKSIDDFTFHPQFVPNREMDKLFRRVDGNRRYRIVRGKRQYMNDYKGHPIPSWWDDIPSGGTATNDPQYTGYPTQKPLKLLERIIKASSNRGDMVFDPFAGCATALVAAERLGRGWVGIDISEKAVDLVEERMRETQGVEFKAGSIIVRRDIPVPSGNQGCRLPLPELKRLKFKQGGGDPDDPDSTVLCTGVCGRERTFDDIGLDRIVPAAAGGEYTESNTQPMCGKCNSSKGAMDDALWREKKAQEKRDVQLKEQCKGDLTEIL